MVDTTLSSRFSSLAATAAKLNKASESLNEILDSFERRLVDANVGLEVWVQDSLSQTDAKEREDAGKVSVCFERRLGFSKVDGKWCVAVKEVRVVSGFYEGDENCPYTDEYLAEDPSPLSRSSRNERIAAVALLPKLVAALEHAAANAVESIERAKNLF